MAQGGKKNGKGPGKSGPARSGQSAARQNTPARTGSAKQQAGRQSVAAVRRNKPGSNRTQVIIGSVAVVLIAAVITIGLVINKQQTAAPVTDYGPSTQSTATFADNVVTVSNGSPSVTIDVFQDMMCPICAQFEEQYGQQINKAVDEGKLAVRYHTLNFLNPQSASKDYSTRASAALQCVAKDATTPKGAWMQFMEGLYADGTQPAEGGSADLTNAQLGEIAARYNVPSTAVSCITAGTDVASAEAAATAGNAVLQAAVGRVATPTVLKDGAPLATNNTAWLTDLVG
ncbi:thioredoxin domain-containing protein [Nakamurella sp. YIM 132087]|uniref:Thioredoxin domain-containing protein n=1 Tax=Nakamurella alba TaxID=2665158 RepID=A0A7K1FGU5_9ACTN|nr:thioredoxin domain-containing protein [Nakamurella alba]MTD13341.1 thioredoxin domain-containing protein [Nakamurella alba]